MGALSSLDVEATPTVVTGEGKRLVEWWLRADVDDRAVFKGWVAAGTTRHVLAERLTASGYPICTHTVGLGLRLLRRLPEWAS